ncbi:terminase small subunit [Bradyrhizobium sp. 613_E4_N2_2]|uniref:terminase small subunit n=1 Tax=Bradyrhizobium sp. 613_E4_N2_2 TaxID=3240371 RepID=UPI003F8AD4F9
MAKGRGQKVNRTQLADVFGVSLPTIDVWTRTGCPSDQKGAGPGKPWVFDTADVAAWREQRAREDATGDEVSDERELKRRKLAAETGKAELEFAIAKGEVAPVREFERAQAGLMASIRQNILQVPSRAVLQLLGETDERTFKSKLAAELTLALETAAESDLTLDDDEGDDE